MFASAALMSDGLAGVPRN